MTFLTQHPGWFLVAFGLFALAWAVAVTIHLAVYLRPVVHTRREARRQAQMQALGVPAQPLPHVSVIVYAHNQADALLRNVPALFEQDYPVFDVIVVDDNSRDETADVLTMMKQRYDHFHHIYIREGVRNISRRKLAMMLGVKAAQGDVILMTMAQCAPVSRRWIASVASSFTSGVDAVLAPVSYAQRTGLVSRFCAYDLFQRQQALFGLTMAVRPYAAWGANMAFRRDAFFADGSRAFCKHLRLRPGADDLFVCEVAQGDNIAVACTSDALVENQHTPIAEEWRQDRRVRAFTSLYYPRAPRLMRGLELATRWLVVPLGLALTAFGALCLASAPSLDLIPILWTLTGAAAGMLLLYWLCVVLCGVALSRMLGLRPFVWAPVLGGLIPPLVDLRYRLAALSHPKRFYVGYAS